MNVKRTPLYQLIEVSLGQDLAEFVAERRPPRPTSWREIAEEISDRTGVEVTHTSLRQWFAEDPADAEPETEPAPDGAR